ncbi:MAG TPA: hypothetical protein VHN14_27880 [Kofleriaceae bacterium]|jgi:hypothetical protein|nr:hypothetical protein [Kofleriaceae bacterium]
MNRPILLAVQVSSAVMLMLIGCGNKSETPVKAKDDAASGPAAAPLAMPALGVDQLKRFNFLYEAGMPAHDKAIAAYRKRDWAAVRTQAEAALEKDPMHLGSHRLLAAALAQTGEPAAAVDHLVTAIAADYLQYAPTLAEDDLKSFMASPHGQSVKALAAKIHDEYVRRIASGLWLVGRRSPFRWPKELGVQTSTTRGELYAFDRESRRIFRLTHTDHQVAGFVRSMSGNEVALVGFDKIDRPKPEAKPEAKPEPKSQAKTTPKLDPKSDTTSAEAAPLIARPWIRVYETAEWTPVTPKITLPSAREVTVGYGAGDQLLVSTAQATGRWTVGEPTVASVDRTTGKLTKVATAPAALRVVLSLDEGHLVRIPDGVVATWTGDPPVTSSLQTTGGKPIQIPESGAASQSSIAVSPSGTHIAFATAADPCAKDAAPSLYVADARTAIYKHLLSAKSRFPTRWIDASVLAYEDGDGAIRLWDATTGRETMRLEDKSGMALNVLSLAAAPLCKQAPPTVESAGANEEPLPPEEGAGGGSAPPPSAPPTTGPVTTPQ